MRISGVTLDDSKRLEISLTAVYGVGRARAHVILDAAGVDYGLKAKDLDTGKEAKVRKAIETYKIEGDLRREKAAHIKRLKEIQSYRGTRHTRGMPVRGQRTRNNARTVKGKRRTMGSGRRTLEKK